MHSSSNSSLNAITSPSPTPYRAFSGVTTTTQAAYSIICSIAILGNALVILVFVLDRKLLKKTYNMLILCLAIADVLTAINVIIAFVLGDPYPHPTNSIVGEIFCRVMWSRAIIFELVFFSVYITLGLTAERWIAVVMPHKYNDIFKRRRIIGYILFSWVCAFLITSGGYPGTAYNPSKQSCQFRTSLKEGSFISVFVSSFRMIIKAFFPCLIMIGLYIHMVVRTITSTAASAESKAKLKGKMTRMIATASFILIICLAPNQILLVLASLGKAKLDTKVHHVTALLTFITTCSNPFIYGLSNRNYRRRYLRILFAMCPRLLGDGAGVVTVNADNRVHPSAP